MKRTEKQSIVIAQVESFIKRVHDGDLIITPEAKSLVMSYPKKNILRLPMKTTKVVADLIGWAMAAYQYDKDVNPQRQSDVAYELLDVIERARAYGVIKSARQISRQYELEIEQLKERVNSLFEENNKLTLENKRLHSLLGDNGGTEVGEVG